MYWKNRCKNWCVLEFSHVAPSECSEYERCEKHLRIKCAECVPKTCPPVDTEGNLSE